MEVKWTPMDPPQQNNGCPLLLTIVSPNELYASRSETEDRGPEMINSER
jgi:hypothetical protein